LRGDGAREATGVNKECERVCVYKERYYRCIYIGNTSNAVQWKRKRESQRESKKEGGWAREGGMGEREIKREEGAK
jgi:hypothetical protein